MPERLITFGRSVYFPKEPANAQRGADWLYEGRLTGVGAGIRGTSYGAMKMVSPELGNAYPMADGALLIAANRPSHFPDLCGPTMAFGTASPFSLTHGSRAGAG
jgi:acyl transferase domain-containing protein